MAPPDQDTTHNSEVLKSYIDPFMRAKDDKETRMKTRYNETPRHDTPGLNT